MSDSEASDDEDDVEDAATPSSPGAPSTRKRRRLQSTSESELETDPESTDGAASHMSNSESDESGDNHPPEELLDFSFSFKNINPGTLVAVGYEDCFYVGEVEEKVDDETAIINFMCGCSTKNTVYKWPLSPDKGRVHEKFVLAASFDMSSANGRFWTLSKENSNLIAMKYQAYKELYFH